MLYNGPYLRVQKPRTTNGTNVVVDPSTRQVVYREDHLPMSAKKHLEIYNKSLPESLKMIIEVVDGFEEQQKAAAAAQVNVHSDIPEFLPEPSVPIVPQVSKPAVPKPIKQS